MNFKRFLPFSFIVLGLTLANLSLRHAPSISFWPWFNPLGLFGSPAGMTLGIALQGPADRVNHAGVTHSHGEDDHDHDHDDHHHSHDEHSAEDIQREILTSQNAAQLFHALNAAKNTRYNLAPLSPEMEDYKNKQLGRLMEFAWRLDPSNTSNYKGMSMFQTSIAKGSPFERLTQLHRYNVITRQMAFRSAWDPGPWFTAAESAQGSYLYAYLIKADQAYLDSEFRLTKVYLDRALALQALRIQDQSFASFPSAKQQEMEESFNNITNILRYIEKKQAEDTSKKP